MEELLLGIGFDKEDIDDLIDSINDNKILGFNDKINVFKYYGCSNSFIKEIIMNRIDIFKIEQERLKYIFDAIISNNDIIEETILEIL